jgi:undecaprenyl-phosphate 4-deoxy-4-formamido-L-arabinose transferase
VSAPKLSIVIPMWNEARNVRGLFERLYPVLEPLGLPFEVVAVDDGSTDATVELLLQEQKTRPGLRIVSFARNFGQHAAVMAGFAESRGLWIVTLDADLQNPPEEIPRLVAALGEGHDLVNTWRVDRHDTPFRRRASQVVNRLMRAWSGIELRDFGCMLRGYHRSVVEPMLRRPELQTFIPALAALYAHSPVEIPVSHAERAHGASAYSLRRLLSLELDLLTSSSVAPLRLLFVLGIGIAAAGIGFGAFLLAMRVLLGAEWAAAGVFTLFAILFVFIGAQFVAFGLLGEYIGRIFQHVRERPPYLVRARHFGAEPPDAPPGPRP